MSKDRAKEFLLKLRTDKKLVSKVEEAYAEVLCRVAGESGFDFSAEDLAKAVEELKEQLSGELSDAEIEAVAGGGALSWGSDEFPVIDPRRF